MKNGQSQSLTDFIPDDIFVGTSLILRDKEQFLYGIRPVRCGARHQILELTGIGGGMEDDDKSLSAGALREAQEEIGCEVRLMACQETLIVRGQNDVQRLLPAGDERPAALVFRNYRTPPHQPWSLMHQGPTCLIVFLAELQGQPYPAMELPYLIWLQPAHILQTARQDIRLRKLLTTGASLIVGKSGVPPAESWVRMTDSQEALALALGEATSSFYQSLCAD